MQTLVVSLLNLLILIVILFVKVKQPARDFLKTRHELLRDELDDVRDQLALAQERFRDFSTKLQSIDQELIALREQSKKEIAEMRTHILEATDRLAKIVISDAKAASHSLYLEFKDQLFAEFSLQAIDRAEVVLKERLTRDDRVRISREFSRQLEAVQ